MSATHIFKIAATTAGLTFLADVTAAVLADGQSSHTTGLWVRLVLVTLAMFAAVAIWSGRIPKRPSPGSTLFTGVLVGWALNPQSWIGRSYGGQLLVDTGLQSGGADLLLWAAAAAGLAFIATSQLEATRR